MTREFRWGKPKGGHGWGRTARWTGITAAAGATFVAILVGFSPIASASPTTNVTFTAPYHFSASPSGYFSYVGCASESTPTAAQWDKTTGVYTVDALASMRGCSGYNSASFDTGISLESRAFRAPAGTGFVLVTFTTAMQVKARLHVPLTTGSYAYASVDLSALIELFDTNGSFVGYGSTSFVSQYFTGNGSFSLSQGPEVSYADLLGTFVAGHHYQLYLEISVSGYVYSYESRATGLVSVNLAGTNGITISSITVY